MEQLGLTEQFAQWKSTLDVPVEHYLECSIDDSEREEIQLSYGEVFGELVQQNKLLNAYRHENASLKLSQEDLFDQLKKCKAFLQNVSMHIDDPQLRVQAIQLAQNKLN